MRIIRLKLKPAVSDVLAEISNLYSIEDVGFTEDLFALFRLNGSGLPTADRLERMADIYSAKANLGRGLTLMHMRKRKHTLDEMTGLPLFKSLCIDCAYEPHNAVRRLLQVFREFTKKRRAAACLSCALRPKCAFGKQYGDNVSDISRVVDPNYATKVDPNCPDYPNIVGINTLFEEMQRFQQINGNTAQGQALAALTPGGNEFLKALENAEEEFAGDERFEQEEDNSDEGLDPEEQADEGIEDWGGGAGKGGNAPPGTHSGKHFAKVNEDFVNKLSVASLQLFELGRSLDEMLKAGLGNKFIPTKEVSKNQRSKRLEESSEITRIPSSDHALPEEHFDAKYAKHDLNVQSFEEQEEKKQLLYVLIDESGSMNGRICDSNQHSFLTRGQVATTLAGALSKRVGDDEGMMFLRFFSDRPGPIMSARTKTEFATMLHEVIHADINGGGTSIIRALREAHRDITTASDEIAKAEVLLITDMDDIIKPEEIEWIKQSFTEKTVKLNVLNVNSNKQSYGNAQTVLAAIAMKYMQVDSKSLDLKGIVTLVK